MKYFFLRKMESSMAKSPKVRVSKRPHGRGSLKHNLEVRNFPSEVSCVGKDVAVRWSNKYYKVKLRTYKEPYIIRL